MTRKRFLVSWFMLLPIAALGLGFWADEASAVRGGSDAASAANRGEVTADDLLNAAWDFTPFEETEEGDQASNTRRDMGDGGMASSRAPSPAAAPLPSRVDNSLLKYFPPILKQSGGSCAQQAAIHNRNDILGKPTSPVGQLRLPE